MEQFKKYLPLIGGIMTISTMLGGGFFLYFKFLYIESVVNPDEVLKYRTEQAIEQTKDKFKWCLGKFVLTTQHGTPLDEQKKAAILGCAD